MHLPQFRYHPDPIATGSIVRSTAKCLCCGLVRGHIYAGPVYSTVELRESICPWCIADGQAHARFNAEFTDAAGVGDYRPQQKLPTAVIEEVAFRTPGFSGWQQERWLACCNDAARFLGPAGCAELQTRWPQAIASVQSDCGLVGEDWQSFLRALSRDGGPTAYVFQCLHCSSYLAYQDCH
jgi:uncharacterized protein CbrC (UPF0167 family)